MDRRTHVCAFNHEVATASAADGNGTASLPVCSISTAVCVGSLIVYSCFSSMYSGVGAFVHLLQVIRKDTQ